MATMNISLTDDLSEFVANKLRTGGYNNQSEVVRAGLRLLRSADEQSARLHRALAEGFTDLDNGRTVELTDAELVDIANQGRMRSIVRKENNV